MDGQCNISFPAVIDINSAEDFDRFIESHNKWDDAVATVMRKCTAIQYETRFGSVVFHPSTRDGYEYQITSLDFNDSPMGHTDCKDLNEAIKEMTRRGTFTEAFVLY